MERLLYGGAIRVAVPPDWADVSTIRQVPDNQEVFVANDDLGQSLIFDIVERANVPDEHIAAYYMQDLAEQNESAETRVFGAGPVHAPGLLQSAQRCPAPAGEPQPPPTCYGVTCHQVIGKFRKTAAEAPEGVDIAMLIMRIPQVEADILVTLNTPAPAPGESRIAGFGGQVLNVEEEAARVMLHPLARIARTFEFLDWGLFNEA